MNALPRGSIVKGRSLVYENETTFKGYELRYPVHEVKGCHYVATVSKIGDYAHAAFKIKADLVLIDSLDGTLFPEKINLEEDCDLLEEMDEEGEGYLAPGSVIDLDDIALRIIISSFPIKVTRPNSSLPKSGKGYRVLSEEEAAKEKDESTNPAFDKLKDFDTTK
jgi:hypothetical protein